MDQLNKNLFWIVCGTLSLAMIGVWFWQSSSVYTLQAANEGAISQAVSQAETVKKTVVLLPEAPADAVKAHPNASSAEGMKKEIDQTIDAVLAAWELRRSKQLPILKWPEEVLRSREFTEQFAKYDPPQKFKLVDDATKQQIVPPLPELMLIYKKQIPERMESIAGIIKTDWKKPETTTTISKSADKSDRPKIAATTDKGLETVVTWNSKNQELWNLKLTQFKTDGNQSETPNPRQVFALQEDLWLLEACFNVIKVVNGDAATKQMAAIKEIDHVVFGREAYTQKMGEIRAPDNVLLSGRVISDSNAPEKKILTKEQREDQAANAGGEGVAVSKEFNFKLDEAKRLLAPFHGRYVDANFQPIDIDELQIALNSVDMVDKHLEAVVAKRIPFRIAVRMEENKIPDLIAAFSNSDFAFEVFQVRINRDPYEEIKIRGDNPAASGGAGGRNTPSVSGAGGGGGQAAQDLAGGASGTDAAAGSGPVNKANIEARRNYDVSVEFYGIVRIYNPVDRNLLKKKLDTAPPAAPAASLTPATETAVAQRQG